MRRWVAVLAVTVALNTPTPTSAAPAPAAVTRATKVFMVADSVGLGARWALQRQFTGNWQLYETGKAGIMTDQLMRWYVDPELKANTYDSAIVATGYNYPYWDPPRFQRMVDAMVNLMVARGVKRIFWVTIREVTPANYSGWGMLAPQFKNLFLAYPTANSIIKKATARHPQLSIIDWAAVSDQRDLTADGIHLNQPGAARYAALAKDIVTGAGSRLAAGTVTRLHPADTPGVAAESVAVALQIAVTAPRATGSATVWPCLAPRPAAPNVVWNAGESTTAAVVAPIDTNGDTCIWQSTEAHLRVTLRGAIDHQSDYQWGANTRTSGAVSATTTLTTAAPPDAPTGAFTALVQLTATSGTAPVAYRVFPCGTTPPLVATFTAFPHSTVNALALVRTSDTGTLCVRSTAAGRASVVVSAMFPASSDVMPVAATRVLDTRKAPAAGARTIAVAGVRSLPAAADLRAALVTATAWLPVNPGWLALGTCPGAASTAKVAPLEPNHPRAASAVLGTDPTTGVTCVFSSVKSALTVDVVGTFGASFTPIADAGLFNR